MKKFDYIVIQAPMISELGLKGNALLLFAMIHGFSKDGTNKYRASLNDMAEWLCTSKSAVVSSLEALVEAGYINKHDVKDSGKSKPEYTTNYDALLAKAAQEGPLKPTLIYPKKVEKSARVLNQYPKQKAVESMGTESVPGTESVTDGYCFSNEMGTVSVPNKYNINIYKYYSCAESAQQQEEKRSFYNLFFMKLADNPAAEVERFIAYNEANGWVNEKGREYETPKQRLGLAGMWKVQEIEDANGRAYRQAVRDLIRDAEARKIPGYEVLMDHRINLRWDGRQLKWWWAITDEAREWVSKENYLVHQYLDPIFKQRTVTFEQIKN